MTYCRRAQQYQRTQVQTACGVELVVMCYEHAIHALKQAKTYYLEKNFEKKAIFLQKALDIIHELNASLDFEKGGEIALNLSSIYNYLITNLLRGDIGGKTSIFDEATRILTELKEAWEEIAKNQGVETNSKTEALNSEAFQRQTAAA